MILYRNTKEKVRSPDVDTDYFDIVADYFDILPPYLCIDYMLRKSIDKMKENGFKLTKERSRRYPAQTITEVEYADDIVLLANTPTQGETLLLNLERVAAGIDLHVNAYKTEYMCFNQTGDIHTKQYLTETSGQVHLPRKYCLINQDKHQHATSKGMDSYR